MNTTSNLTVKAYYFPSSEIRRFQVPYVSTFTALREKLLAHLPQEGRQNRVTVKYLDDEDEWVTISEVSDEEDWNVVRTSFKQPIVRLRVCLMSSSPSPQPLHEPALLPPMPRFGARAHFGGCHHKSVHWGVVCDGCDMRPIRGIRYKCNECPDFDFCETCFARAKDLHNPSHSFQKIEFRHHGRRWNNGACCHSSPRQESPAHKDPLQSATVVISNQPAEEACQSEASCASQEPVVIEVPPAAAADSAAAAPVSPAPVSPPSNPEPVSSSVPLPPPVIGRANVESAPAPASESVEAHPASRIWNMLSPLIAGANNDAEPEFASELATLEAMGLLDDRERALRLLRRRRGNLQLVVNELLQ